MSLTFHGTHITCFGICLEREEEERKRERERERERESERPNGLARSCVKLFVSCQSQKIKNSLRDTKSI
jgi:hypothetical protein